MDAVGVIANEGPESDTDSCSVSDMVSDGDRGELDDCVSFGCFFFVVFFGAANFPGDMPMRSPMRRSGAPGDMAGFLAAMGFVATLLIMDWGRLARAAATAAADVAATITELRRGALAGAEVDVILGERMILEAGVWEEAVAVDEM